MCEATSVFYQEWQKPGKTKVFVVSQDVLVLPKNSPVFHFFPGWQQRERKMRSGGLGGPHFDIKKGSTYVCSRHFTSEDHIWGCNVSPLIPRAVPSLVPWNSFKSCPKRVYLWQIRQASVCTIAPQWPSVICGGTQLQLYHDTPTRWEIFTRVRHLLSTRPTRSPFYIPLSTFHQVNNYNAIVCRVLSSYFTLSIDMLMICHAS